MGMELLRAACYCRLSDDDLNDGTSISIDTQKMMHKQYCQNNQILIVDFYCDDGYTGTNFDRPEFKRMMEDVKKRKVNAIIVKDLSRFGRESIYVNYYTQVFFPENNITFIIISENKIITTNSKYDIMLSLKSAINEMYPAEISEKVRQAFAVKALNGEFLHPYIPFGYLKSETERNKLVVDPLYGPLVKEIFEMVAYRGMGMLAICKYLYDNQIPKPAAHRRILKGDYSDTDPYNWNKSTLNNLLHNEVYTGKIILGKTRKVNFKSKKIIEVDRSEWNICENAHEAIISQDLFDEVQNILQTRRRERRPEYIENIFRSVIKCADCGSPMYITNPKTAGRSPYYICGRSQLHSGNPDKCTSHNIKYDVLCDVVMRDLNKLIVSCNTDGDAFRSKVLEQIKANQPEFSALQDEIISLETKIAREKAKYKRLYNDYYDGIIKETAMFEEMIAECSNRMDMYNARKEKLSFDLAKGREEVSDTIKFVERVSKYIRIEKLTEEILNTLITKIEVNEKTPDESGEMIQNISIHYKFVGELK